MDTLGIIESKSIAAGVLLADVMTKAAEVELLRAAAVCSGRYLIFISGDKASVAAGVDRARELAAEKKYLLSGSFVLPNIATQVLEVMKKRQEAADGEALGIIECRNVSAGVAAADRAVKKATVRMLRFVAGHGINGKSYFVLGGDMASVNEASDAAKEILGSYLVEAVVIPRPSLQVARALTSELR